jgi:hypothetical protein
MATSGNNVRLPEDLLAELEAQAQPRGLTPDELAVETLRAGLRRQSWLAMPTVGRNTAKPPVTLPTTCPTSSVSGGKHLHLRVELWRHAAGRSEPYTRRLQ